MTKYLFYIILIFLFAGCEERLIDTSTSLPLLTLDDIKNEYIIADSLNKLEDRSSLIFKTRILGIDSRNNQTIIRTPINRGFGCLMFEDYFTILYLNCDSVCCEENGFWLVDYVGFAGFRTPVGCAPDTIQNEVYKGCECEN